MAGKKVLFIILLVVFAGIAAYDLGVFKSVTDQEASNEVRSPRVPKLRLDLLEREKPPYKGVKRDIFTLPKPPRAPRPKVVAIAEQVPEPAPVVMEPIMPPQPSELQLFASQARYIGLLAKRAERTVFINSGNDVLTVKKGDVIGARFKVEDITEDALVLTDSMTGEEARITLQTGPR